MPSLPLADGCLRSSALNGKPEPGRVSPCLAVWSPGFLSCWLPVYGATACLRSRYLGDNRIRGTYWIVGVVLLEYVVVFHSLSFVGSPSGGCRKGMCFHKPETGEARKIRRAPEPAPCLRGHSRGADVPPCRPLGPCSLPRGRHPKSQGSRSCPSHADSGSSTDQRLASGDIPELTVIVGVCRPLFVHQVMTDSARCVTPETSYPSANLCPILGCVGS